VSILASTTGSPPRPGYVLTTPTTGRNGPIATGEWCHPDDACLHTVRGMPGYLCQLPPGHRGYHSCQVFYCDGCGKVRRGTPAARGEDVAMCFLCTRESAYR